MYKFVKLDRESPLGGGMATDGQRHSIFPFDVLLCGADTENDGSGRTAASPNCARCGSGGSLFIIMLLLLLPKAFQ